MRDMSEMGDVVEKCDKCRLRNDSVACRCSYCVHVEIIRETCICKCGEHGVGLCHSFNKYIEIKRINIDHEVAQLAKIIQKLSR